MIRRSIHSILALLFFCGIGLYYPSTAHSQFLDLQLQVDSQLSAHTERPLNFGTLTTNSGIAEIPLGAPNMGIFSIRALENQMLLITMSKPSELHHDNPAIEETIPLDLLSRYGYSAQNYQNSYPLPEASTGIEVAPTPNPGPWSLIYIFIYGSIEIGDVPDGTYDNEIVLSVEYI